MSLAAGDELSTKFGTTSYTAPWRRGRWKPIPFPRLCISEKWLWSIVSLDVNPPSLWLCLRFAYLESEFVGVCTSRCVCHMVWRRGDGRRSGGVVGIPVAVTELETSARTEDRRMTNHNTLQLSRMDLSIHCAAFPGHSCLNTTTVLT